MEEDVKWDLPKLDRLPANVLLKMLLLLDDVEFMELENKSEGYQEHLEVNRKDAEKIKEELKNRGMRMGIKFPERSNDGNSNG